MKGDKNVIEYLNKALRHALPPARQLGLQGAGQDVAQGID
jgi:bacterioferritin (cytochrome b1)